MPYAVELFFDDAADARVRSIKATLAHSTSPNLRAGESRPHISLLVAERVNVPAAVELLDRFAGSTPKFPLSLASAGVFPGPQAVAFLAPKVTSELLLLHARFFSDFKPVASELWTYYSPAEWVPHCTLAEGVDPSRIGSLYSVRLPIAVTISEVGLVEFSPSMIRQIHRCALPGLAEIP